MRRIMLDNETQSLNYVVVNFITPDRKKITDSLKIFKTVGESYRVNTPSLDGYILDGYRGNLEGVMGEKVEQVELVYERLGKLTIQSGLDETNIGTKQFKISRHANRVQVIELPKIQGSEDYYYLEENDGEKRIGKRVVDPDNFLPDDPTQDVHLLKLTLDQIDELTKLWSKDKKAAVSEKTTTEIEEVENPKEDVAYSAIVEESEIPEEVEQVQVIGGDTDMSLTEPTVLLLNAFKQVMTALVEYEKQGNLTRSQRTRLIKHAKSLLTAVERLN